MSPPLLGVGEDEGQSNAMLLASFASLESICNDGADLKEHNYMGLSDCSSVDSSNVSTTLEGNSRKDLNLKATKLRLRLPGSGSPERDSEPCPLNSVKLDEKLLFPLCPMNTVVKGNKRGFFDAMDEFTERKDISTLEVNLMASSRPSVNSNVKVGSLKENPATQPAKMKEAMSQNAAEVTPHTKSVNILNHVNGANNDNSARSTKAQVIGWPPIRQSRKSTLASASKNTEEVDGKTSGSALFVKVSMDGAPYLRKVNLRTYPAYRELSSALEKMFSGFTIDQNASHGAQSKEMLGENKLNNLLHGSEYVLTYEDKDGDWMLVGDVPWEMFINTCRRLRIMESSDAIGLAPRVVEKIRNGK